MRTNVLNAALVLCLMRVTPERTSNILGEWTGLQHRLEKFHETRVQPTSIDLTFYNDTCATVPEATAAALKSFDQSVVLISGGTDKGLDFTPLMEVLTSSATKKYRPRKIYLLAGTGTDKLLPLLDEKNIRYEGPFDSLEKLLASFKADLESESANRAFSFFRGDGTIPVVFSPGATSFGMFTNEFDRGNKFKNQVKELFKN